MVRLFQMGLIRNNIEWDDKGLLVETQCCCKKTIISQYCGSKIDRPFTTDFLKRKFPAVEEELMIILKRNIFQFLFYST